MRQFQNDLGFHFDSFRRISKNINSIVSDAKENRIDARELSADIFNALYQFNPKVKKADGSEYNAVIRQILSSKEVQEFRTQTKGNLDLSILAAAILTDEISKAKPKDKPEDKPGDGSGEKFGEEESGFDSYDDGLESESDSQLADAIAKGVEESDKMSGGHSWGHSNLDSSATGSDRIADFAAEIYKNPAARKIFEIVGKLKTVSQGFDSVSLEIPQSMVSITTGRDLQRMIPLDLMGMRSKGIQKALWAQSYSEGKLRQIQMAGTNKVGNGPMVVCIDSSSSMHSCYNRYSRNNSIHDACPAYLWARAIALASYQTALKKKRDFAIIIFGDSSEIQTFTPKSKSVYDPEFVKTLIAFDYNGGTNFETPFRSAINFMQSKGGSWKKADIIFSTDGAAGVNQQVWIDLKKQYKIRLLSFLIGVRDYSVKNNPLSLVSDATMSIPDVTDLDKASEVISTINYSSLIFSGKK